MIEDELLLTWDDFEKCVPAKIRELQGDDNFTDVTLVTEDDRQIKAHKVIISSCSRLFRNILIKNPHKHPLIYLKAIQYEELHKLVEFIYVGQCKVEQTKLHSFLSAAKSLKMQGLELFDNVTKKSTEVKVAIAKEEMRDTFEDGECAVKVNNQSNNVQSRNSILDITETNKDVFKEKNIQISRLDESSDEEGYIGAVETKLSSTRIKQKEDSRRARDLLTRLLKDPTRYFKKIPINYICRWRALRNMRISVEKLNNLEDKAIVGRNQGQLGLFYPKQELEKIEELEIFLPENFIAEKIIFHSMTRPERSACNFPSSFRDEAIVGKQKRTKGRKSHFYTRELVEQHWPHLLEKWQRKEELKKEEEGLMGE